MHAGKIGKTVSRLAMVLLLGTAITESMAIPTAREEAVAQGFENYKRNTGRTNVAPLTYSETKEVEHHIYALRQKGPAAFPLYEKIIARKAAAAAKEASSSDSDSDGTTSSDSDSDGTTSSGSSSSGSGSSGSGSSGSSSSGSGSSGSGSSGSSSSDSDNEGNSSSETSSSEASAPPAPGVRPRWTATLGSLHRLPNVLENRVIRAVETTDVFGSLPTPVAQNKLKNDFLWALKNAPRSDANAYQEALRNFIESKLDDHSASNKRDFKMKMTRAILDGLSLKVVSDDRSHIIIEEPSGYFTDPIQLRNFQNNDYLAKLRREGIVKIRIAYTDSQNRAGKPIYEDLGRFYDTLERMISVTRSTITGLKLVTKEEWEKPLHGEGLPVDSLRAAFDKLMGEQGESSSDMVLKASEDSSWNTTDSSEGN